MKNYGLLNLIDAKIQELNELLKEVSKEEKTHIFLLHAKQQETTSKIQFDVSVFGSFSPEIIGQCLAESVAKDNAIAEVVQNLIHYFIEYDDETEEEKGFNLTEN